MTGFRHLVTDALVELIRVSAVQAGAKVNGGVAVCPRPCLGLSHQSAAYALPTRIGVHDQPSYFYKEGRGLKQVNAVDVYPTNDHSVTFGNVEAVIGAARNEFQPLRDNSRRNGIA